tara:strand:+ start:287 stop:898 length:612 start_codon:yes stop_codon:yes gene_type:complete
MNLEFLQLGSNNCNKVIVFIHGWKGNKNSFESLPSIIKISDSKWFFPQAPYIVNNINKEFSWAFENSDGTFEIDKTINLFSKFIDEHILSFIDSKKVFFIGFSQGATLCYHLILQLGYQWGGVFPIAGFKRNNKSILTIHENQKNTPIIIGHGLNDDVIPISSSEEIYNDLKKNNSNVHFEKFNGGHKISINFLKKIQSIING